MKYSFLCPEGCGVVNMVYLGYQRKPYHAHRYKCPDCNATVLANSPRLINKKYKVREVGK